MASILPPIRTGPDNDATAWTFVQGPGVDDPLLAFSPTDAKYLFYVTDGAGRQLRSRIVRDSTC